MILLFIIIIIHHSSLSSSSFIIIHHYNIHCEELDGCRTWGRVCTGSLWAHHTYYNPTSASPYSNDHGIQIRHFYNHNQVVQEEKDGNEIVKEKYIHPAAMTCMIGITLGYIQSNFGFHLGIPAITMLKEGGNEYRGTERTIFTAQCSLVFKFTTS